MGSFIQNWLKPFTPMTLNTRNIKYRLMWQIKIQISVPNIKKDKYK